MTTKAEVITVLSYLFVSHGGYHHKAAVRQAVELTDSLFEAIPLGDFSTMDLSKLVKESLTR